MLDKGYESLSEKQKFVFNLMINDNIINECQKCGIDIPWCEMLDALNNGNLCNYCRHIERKMETK